MRANQLGVDGIRRLEHSAMSLGVMFRSVRPATSPQAVAHPNTHIHAHTRTYRIGDNMRKCPHDGSECRWIDDCWFCPECREEFYPLPDEADDPEGYSLVMPFVVVASRGGPFDDQAYAAGWEMGAIEVRLQMACLLGLGLPHVTVLRSNLPQIELLAMKHGLLITENEWPDYVDAIVTDTWAFLSFSQGGET